MKKNATLAILLFTPFLAFADHHSETDHPGHSHGTESEKGKETTIAEVGAPNGGRLLKGITPITEFFVTAERKVQITFLRENGTVIPPSTQIVTVVSGKRSAPTTLTFEKTDTAFLSKSALPEGDSLPAIITIKTAPDAQSQRARLSINLADCSSCDHQEYACACNHDHDDHDDHEHSGHNHD